MLFRSALVPVVAAQARARVVLKAVAIARPVPVVQAVPTALRATVAATKSSAASVPANAPRAPSRTTTWSRPRISARPAQSLPTALRVAVRHTRPVKTAVVPLAATATPARAPAPAVVAHAANRPKPFD